MTKIANLFHAGKLLLQKLVTAARNALLDGLENSPLLEDRTLPIAFGLGLEPIADIGNVYHAPLVQVVADDEVPRRTGSIQPLAVVTGDYAVAGRLVGVVGQDVGVEVCRVVGHGSCRGRRTAVGARRACALYGGRSPQDLILCADLLEISLEALVLGGCVLLGSLKRGQLGFQVLDVALFSFSEGSLTI